MGVTGRKTKLNPELIKAICALVRAGNYPTTAGACLGIGHGTIALWRMKGRKHPNSLFGAFEDGILKAEAQSQADLVAVVVNAAKTDNPKWAQGFLSRRWASEFGRRDNLTVDSVNVTVDVDALKARLVAKLEAWRPEPPRALESGVATPQRSFNGDSGGDTGES